MNVYGKIFGTLTAYGRIQGSLVSAETIYGSLSVPTHLADVYTGAYEVTPKAYEAQVLPTEGRVMLDDVTVFKVPYYETINLFDGKTAYIAEEV